MNPLNGTVTENSLGGAISKNKHAYQKLRSKAEIEQTRRGTKTRNRYMYLNNKKINRIAMPTGFERGKAGYIYLFENNNENNVKIS